MSDDADPLLEVEDLRTYFHTDAGDVRAVDGVSFTVDRGETVCLVGESGSGKTVTSESITRLFDSPPGEIVGGSVRFKGRELTEMSEDELRGLRGREISHVFQNPQGALNPVYTVGTQIVEAIRLHEDVGGEAARARAVDLLERVSIPDAARRIDDYPHEFSGGMKQRVLIAIALAARPDLLVADEPTTALDVTIQAQILDLLRDLQEEFDMSVVFVTHDLGVVAEVADRVVVMYAGKVMERGDVFDLFEDPAHPYTRALLDCLPGRGEAVDPIGGSLPDPTDPPSGCRFHPRCPYAVHECTQGSQPRFQPARGDGHEVSCVYYGEGYDASIVREDRRGAAPGGDRADGGEDAAERRTDGGTGQGSGGARR